MIPCTPAAVWATGAALCLWLTPSTAQSARREIDLATTSDTFTMLGNAIWDRTGTREAGCDANGDGVEDLLIAGDQADGVTGTRYDAGEAWLVLGRRGRWQGVKGIASVAVTRIIGTDPLDNLGRAVACGDLNGDDYDDLVIAAINANGPSNTETQTGEVYIVFGRANWPASIDLAQGGSTVIYGETRLDLFGTKVSVGDLNADGTVDLVVGARNAENGAGLGDPGRAYLFFGRQQWPGSLLSSTQSDVKIFGRGTLPDWFGGNHAVGDLDGDHTADLVINASSGDGPGDQRIDAGELFLFHGRTSWPAEIDLSHAASDTWVIGADAGDNIGFSLALALGDVTGSGRNRLFVGAADADGPIEDRYAAGECSSVSFANGFPPQIDLKTTYSSIAYASTANDQAGWWVAVGAIDGPNIADLAFSATKADGPNDSRTDCGETLVILGSPQFPAYADFAAGDGDMIVYGKSAGERSTLKALADLNGDGFDEIAIGAWIDSTDVLSELRLVSPYDSDGDGISQLADNCPLVSNAAQTDSNGDLRGDACQTDWDGDSLPDTQDCAPANALGGQPGEVQGLRFAGGSKTVLNWDATPFGQAYEITRGNAALLAGSNYGSCVTGNDPNPSDTSFTDASAPAAGQAFTYLISARNLVCNLSGTLGTKSSGAPRVNSNPAACTP